MDSNDAPRDGRANGFTTYRCSARMRSGTRGVPSSATFRELGDHLRQQRRRSEQLLQVVKDEQELSITELTQD